MEDRFADLKFTLPYPPSLNVYWRNFRGRMVLSKEAKNYKEKVSELFDTIKTIRPEHRLPKQDLFWSIGLKIDVYRPRKSGDLDNTLKAILDSLSKNLYEDDRQVIEISAHRYDDKERPRIEVGVRFVKRID